MNTKQVVEYYDSIPSVPEDFDGAVAVHARALKAIYYHSEELKFIDQILERRRYDQHRALRLKWQRVKEEAAAVIKTYQLPLF